ncbi:PHP domain protein [Spirochaeta thermophila DSM 6578]|uniref:PHP domain protein n=1 Tax=Winmispira thermophila (strain ATCC 700085 / DSM 6578 / Z-1203) TaxID=869211 RepID=G0GAG0_WINT7|nr:PHP domain-containing protein [Spirochaeta thermophila]AEJ61779.1 PHP domain protein [Spirochaeta thermophila DSM 6578]
MRWWKADLHIHSCVSPCGDLSMGPRTIVRRAAEEGLALIALTDHNTARNAPAVHACGEEAGLTVLPGLELTTAEELHMLAIFPTLEAALKFSSWWEASLITVPHNPERYGDQPVVNAAEEIIEEIPFSLASASTVDLHRAVKAVHEQGGLAIPSHIDRGAFSCYSQLGFLPDEPFDAVELWHIPPQLETRGYPIITNSDAHFPDRIGARYFLFQAVAPTFSELKKALTEGRIRWEVRDLPPGTSS